MKGGGGRDFLNNNKKDPILVGKRKEGRSYDLPSPSSFFRLISFVIILFSFFLFFPGGFLCVLLCFVFSFFLLPFSVRCILLPITA